MDASVGWVSADDGHEEPEASDEYCSLLGILSLPSRVFINNCICIVLAAEPCK